MKKSLTSKVETRADEWIDLTADDILDFSKGQGDIFHHITDNIVPGCAVKVIIGYKKTSTPLATQ